jgi:hypothetical protein
MELHPHLKDLLGELGQGREVELQVQVAAVLVE